MTQSLEDGWLPSIDELQQHFFQKYGRLEQVGWAPRRRFRHGYYLPSDVYEATVKKLVWEGCNWIDIGGGHNIFPENPSLALELASQCSLVVGVDPSENIQFNQLVHQRSQCLLEDYQTDQKFDLATFRMVAEHIAAPDKVLRALNRLLCPGGVVVLLTVNLWAPITLISRLTPFGLHYPIKKLFWGGEEKDTFPVKYRMNTRKTLLRYFSRYGFREVAFCYIDDLCTFGRFYYLNYIEVLGRKLTRTLGFRYPENCLLGVYQRETEVAGPDDGLTKPCS